MLILIRDARCANTRNAAAAATAWPATAGPHENIIIMSSDGNARRRGAAEENARELSSGFSSADGPEHTLLSVFALFIIK